MDSITIKDVARICGAVPVEEMAYATIKILFDIIKNKVQNQQKVFKGQLIEGQSTKKRQ